MIFQIKLAVKSLVAAEIGANKIFFITIAKMAFKVRIVEKILAADFARIWGFSPVHEFVPF
jgi:hypothetical protein